MATPTTSSRASPARSPTSRWAEGGAKPPGPAGGHPAGGESQRRPRPKARLRRPTPNLHRATGRTAIFIFTIKIPPPGVVTQSPPPKDLTPNWNRDPVASQGLLNGPALGPRGRVFFSCRQHDTCLIRQVASGGPESNKHTLPRDPVPGRGCLPLRHRSSPPPFFPPPPHPAGHRLPSRPPV